VGRKKDDIRVKAERIDLLVKRCPECGVNLPLDARRCFSCHTRIGRADKHGMARKSINWVSYLVCIVSWAILIFYIKWAFLSP
jgi:ribosomal protein L40E